MFMAIGNGDYISTWDMTMTAHRLILLIKEVLFRLMWAMRIAALLLTRPTLLWLLNVGQQW